MINPKIGFVAFVILFLGIFNVATIARSQDKNDKISTLIQNVYSNDKGLRRDSANTLISFGKRAVRPLIDVLKNQDADNFDEAFIEACYVLGKLKDKDSIDPLIDIIGYNVCPWRPNA